MSTQGMAISEAAVVTNNNARVPAWQLLYWTVRRELWESRWVYLGPAAIAALLVVGTLIGLMVAARRMGEGWVDVSFRGGVGVQALMSVGALMMGVTFLVAVFYCLDALHGERKDRSILFWKSLPVSDWMTVLGKATIPLLLIPLITFVITVVTEWIILGLSLAFAAGTGGSARELWRNLPLGQMTGVLLYHLVAIHVLWYAPIYAWLLLVSAWAKRVPLLWATLPVLALGVVERIAFHTSYVGEMLKNRLSGGAEGAAFNTDMATNPMMRINPGAFLVSPGLWIGFVVAGVLLTAAVQMRHYREPI